MLGQYVTPQQHPSVTVHRVTTSYYEYLESYTRNILISANFESTDKKSVPETYGTNKARNDG